MEMIKQVQKQYIIRGVCLQKGEQKELLRNVAAEQQGIVCRTVSWFVIAELISLSHEKILL